ncbi:MAG: amidase, partial [Chloroflexi bacterium]|nr:amidase [Chloroflexota bacterium]
ASEDDVRDRIFGARALTTPYNLSGLPAVSVPCGFTRSGLPIGMQIGGRAFDEATVLQVASAYERATDWHTRHPEI